MKKAFTLIELLVVIAIIAILATILFPVFAQARAAAKKTADLSNVKQISLGLFLFVNDYDDTFPQVSYEQDTSALKSTPGFAGTYNPQNPYGTYQIHWTYNIQPYIRNWNIFVHPLDVALSGSKGEFNYGVKAAGQNEAVATYKRIGEISSTDNIHKEAGPFGPDEKWTKHSHLVTRSRLVPRVRGQSAFISCRTPTFSAVSGAGLGPEHSEMLQSSYGWHWFVCAPPFDWKRPTWAYYDYSSITQEASTKQIVRALCKTSAFTSICQPFSTTRYKSGWGRPILLASLSSQVSPSCGSAQISRESIPTFATNGQLGSVLPLPFMLAPNSRKKGGARKICCSLHLSIEIAMIRAYYKCYAKAPLRDDLMAAIGQFKEFVRTLKPKVRGGLYCDLKEVTVKSGMRYQFEFLCRKRRGGLDFFVVALRYAGVGAPRWFELGNSDSGQVEKEVKMWERGKHPHQLDSAA